MDRRAGFTCIGHLDLVEVRAVNADAARDTSRARVGDRTRELQRVLYRVAKTSAGFAAVRGGPRDAKGASASWNGATCWHAAGITVPAGTPRWIG